MPPSIKQLAEVTEAIITLQSSETPSRLKRMRLRALRKQADAILADEQYQAPHAGLCYRCQEGPPLTDGRYCRSCTEFYIDFLPRLAENGDMAQGDVDRCMAELMNIMLKNNLIGIIEG